jgi:hypothetical protein
METYKIEEDIKVFGKRVPTFPMGIKEAYDSLVEIVPDALRRAYYGLSSFAGDGTILYFATVEEAYPGEGKVYDLETYTIEKGEYLSETVLNWYTQTDSIKTVFNSLMQYKDADLTQNCVEWYKSDYEMLCMVKKKIKAKNLQLS